MLPSMPPAERVLSRDATDATLESSKDDAAVAAELYAAVARGKEDGRESQGSVEAQEGTEGEAGAKADPAEEVDYAARNADRIEIVKNAEEVRAILMEERGPEQP